MVKPGEGLVILRVCKTIRDEAETILYSEGTFRIEMLFRRDEVCSLPAQVTVDRMMNIVLEMNVGMQVKYVDHRLAEDFCLEYLDTMKRNWKATMDHISRADTVRNTIHVRCRLCTPNVMNGIPQWMYQQLRGLRRFRTIVVELYPELLTHIEAGNLSFGTDGTEKTVQEMDFKVNAIRECLEDSLGSGVVGQMHEPGHQNYNRSLEFHPVKHIPANLTCRAEDREQMQMDWTLRPTALKWTMSRAGIQKERRF